MLSRIPLELLRAISDHLDIQDQACLAMVNQRLRFGISPTLQDFLQAETGEWAASKQLYTCKGCVSFHKDVRFADAMRKGRCFARGGSLASLRLCIQCGLESNLYREGMTIAYLGRRAVLGTVQQLTDYSPRRTLSLYMMKPQPYWDRHHSTNAEGWTSAKALYIDRNLDEVDVHWF